MIKKFIETYSILLTIETFVLIVLSLLCNLFWDYEASESYFFNSLNVPLVFNLWRFIYYSIPLIILYFTFFRFVERKNKISAYLKYSIFNSLAYLALTLLFKLHKGIPSLEFKDQLFWVMLISIFLSPFVLFKIRSPRLISLLNDKKIE